MMNLAFRDIKHNFGRFLLTTAGISLLLMVVMGMGGIYRGLIQEATLIIDRSGADIWILQRNTKGPFAEVSKLPRQMDTVLKRSRVLIQPSRLSLTPFSGIFKTVYCV